MISTSTPQLREALSKARLLAGRTSGAPIFTNVVLNARPENAWLTITAANIDAQIALDVDADVSEPVAVCVDAERLSLALQAPGETTKLVIEGERLKVSTGRSVFRLPTIPTDNFPLLASSGDVLASFTSDWLGGAIKMVLPFTGSSDSPHTCSRGVALVGLGDAIRVDGTTMAVLGSAVRATPGIGNFSVMLPRRVAEVVEALAPTKAILKTATSLFLAENMQLVAKHLNANIPDLTIAWPKKGKSITVDRAEFVAAVKVVGATADLTLKRFKVLKLVKDGDTMVISVEGLDSDGRIEIAAGGDALDAHYDAGLLLDLAAIGDEDALVMGFDERGVLGVEIDGMRAAGSRYRA
jgi:DNA polymerase-3 subunit beta